MENKVMSKLKKYPAYKDSDIEWLGDIPEHWKVKRLASFGVFSKGGGFSKNDLIEDGKPAILYGDIYTKYDHDAKDVVRRVSNNTAMNSKEIIKNTLLFTGSGETKEDIGKCIVYIGEEKVYVGGDVIVYEQYENNSGFLSYILNTDGIKNEKAKTSKGEIIVHTYASKLRNLYISIPPILEQTTIVDFLDKKTDQINKAISLNQKQISLLKERKQIIIQNAVTKGITPNVKMKDSGINWIGEIPEHWEVKKLKYILSERTEKSELGEEPLFMVSQIHGLVVRADYHVKAEVAQSNIGNKIVYKNDLVFNKLKAHLGVFFKSNIDYPGLVSPDYAVYYSSGLITDLLYLEYLFRLPAYICHFISKATGIVEGLIRLYTGDLYDIKIPIPSKGEQNQILIYINTEVSKTNKAITLQEQQIEKLKEYKATLINSAVTGKIKVN